MNAPAVQSYRLDAPIAQGGFGRVWRGEHVPTGRTVALKLLSATGTDPRTFRAEAEAIASLDHSSVVEVIDVGVVTADEAAASNGQLEAGAPWIAMEWVPDGPLALTDTPLLWPDLIDVLDQTLGALAHAHARGVLHLDIKPTNLLCDCRGDDLRIVITDFGAARLVSDTTRAEAAHLTPGWTAPEVLLGHSWEVGRGADLYSVGVLAWRLATGRMPVEADAWEDVVAAHALGVTLEWPDHLIAPPGFVPWVERLLTPDPARRFAHATLARRALDSMTPPVSSSGSWRRIEVHRTRGTGAGVSSLRRIGIVGRTRERAGLSAALDEITRSRRSRGVVICGEAGVGKSHLARWLAEYADESLAAQVVRVDARGGLPSERAVARALGLEGVPFREATRLLVGRMRASGLTVEDAAAVASTFSPRSDDDSLPPVTTHAHGAWRRPEVPTGARPALWLAALESFAPLRPLVVIVDDVDRDDDAEAWLTALGRHAGRRGALFVGTWRDHDEGRAWPMTPTSVPLATLTLGPLSDEDASELLQRWIGLDASTSERVARMTRGNPLFATELVREWVETDALKTRDGAYVVHTGSAPRITESVREVWEDRVERVVDALADRDMGWRIVERAAILGAFVHWDEWRRATLDASTADVEAIVAAAWRQRLWKHDRDGFVFSHPLAHEVIVDATIRSGRAREHHLACAAAIVDDSFDATLRRIDHYIGAGQTDDAWRMLVLAVRERALAHAPSQLTRIVVRMFELAGRREPDAPGTSHVEARLWDATVRRTLQGRMAPAMHALDQLVELADEVGTPRQRARARVRRITGLIARRRFDDAEEELAGLRKQSRTDGDSWWALRTRVLSLRLLRESGRTDEAVHMAERMALMELEVPWIDQWYVLEREIAETWLAADRPDDARRLARRLARDAARTGHTVVLSQARHLEALALYAVGRVTAALGRLGEAERLARTQQLPWADRLTELRATWQTP